VSKAPTLYFSPKVDSISDGVGDRDALGDEGTNGVGDEGGDMEAVVENDSDRAPCTGAVRALAAPALVVIIVSNSDSLESSSTDMNTNQRYRSMVCQSIADNRIYLLNSVPQTFILQRLRPPVLSHETALNFKGFDAAKALQKG
jgi:hypothetical protein